MQKLIKNVIYGKAIKTVRNRTNRKPVNNEKFYLKCTSKPSYMSQKVFDSNLVALQQSKITLALSKSAYIGMCILDLNKELMYEFHYDDIKNKYGNN